MYPKEFPTATEHDYDMDERGYWVCQTCGHSVKIKRDGTCIGIPIYWKWDNVPEGIATKTTLYKEHGLKVSPDQQPVGAKVQYDRKGKETGGYYPLYLIADATPKKKATPQQLAALEKARYMAEKLIVKCCQCGRREEGRYDYIRVTRKQWIENDYDQYVCGFCGDRAEAILWATGILIDDNALILDTETTDLYGEIIEIAVIDMKGNVLLNQRIKPQGEMSPGAFNIHQISLDDLKDEPTFPHVYPQLVELLSGKQVVIYNAAFDESCLSQDCSRYDLEPIPFESQCAMEWYAQFYGDWSSYHGSYRWQSLMGGDHSALGDCKATLKLIHEMANSESEVIHD